jgi:hypothetical protein
MNVVSFIFLFFHMVTKKTTQTSTRKAAPQKAVATPVKKPAVVTKTTQPKVIVQTKSLHEPTSFVTSKVADGCCQGKCKGKCIRKLISGLAILIILVLSILGYCKLRDIHNLVVEQQTFLINSNGGVENYNTLKQLYATPEFQQASSLSVYQLAERVQQTLQAVQQAQTETTTANPTMEGVVPNPEVVPQY